MNHLTRIRRALTFWRRHDEPAIDHRPDGMPDDPFDASDYLDLRTGWVDWHDEGGYR